MKRFWWVLMLVAFLIGCGGDKPTAPAPMPAPVVSPGQEKKEPVAPVDLSGEKKAKENKMKGEKK